VAVVGLAAAVSTRSRFPVPGAVCALCFATAGAGVLVVRKPDGGERSANDLVGSPWFIAGCAMLLAGLTPLLTDRLVGAQAVTSPAAAALTAGWIVLALAALAGLVERRCPAQGSVVLLGEGIVPMALAFVGWVVALQHPRLLETGAWGDTVAAAVLGGGLWTVAGAGFVRRSDDEERPVMSLVCGALLLVVAAEALRVGAARTATRIDPSWSVSATVAAMGLWLAATLHPALGANVPAAPTRSTSMTGHRRLLIPLIMLLAGPVLVLLNARTGLRSPVLIALGAGVLIVMVSSYLLVLVGRVGRLEQLAYRDELTGLANRPLFIDRLELALARARRDQTGVAVLFVDLDRFKNINDSLGHAAGNEVLKTAAHRVRDVGGEAGFVARLGGDEFALFLGGLVGDAGVVSTCTELVRAFELPLVAQGSEVFVTASVGVARFPEAGHDAETLMRNADAAMYKAKRHGRDTFEVYRPELNSASRHKLSLESRLHSAIDRGELRLHYQPKVALTDGSIVGVEALVRWQHPDRGLLQPDAFIQLAEESGLIVRIDEWVLEEACEQSNLWRQAGFQALTVAVNLSARDFQHRQVEDMVASVLRRTGLDPDTLELELTETLAQQDPGRTRASLLDLKRMGVHCSIDDFGTGYSSLNSLANLPIDRLKIDKSFVDRIGDGRQYAVVAGVISLAHGLGLEITAEGVETIHQLEFLQAHGCDVMQGYLFSAPLEADRLEQTLMLEQVGGPTSRLRLLGGIWSPKGPNRPPLPLPRERHSQLRHQDDAPTVPAH
jgi:diguanylate cyclase (GGDEF)-like protein